MVAPIGNTKLVTSLETFTLSLTHFIVTGSVALDELVEKAVTIADAIASGHVAERLLIESDGRFLSPRAVDLVTHQAPQTWVLDVDRGGWGYSDGSLRGFARFSSFTGGDPYCCVCHVGCGRRKNFGLWIARLYRSTTSA